MNKDIIRIALAQGWETDGNGNWRTEPYNPDRAGSGWVSKEYLPNPLTSHDDCHALIEWLGSQGWYYECHKQPTNDPDMAAGCWLEFWQEGTEIHHRWDGDRELHNKGVVELTLKILDEPDEYELQCEHAAQDAKDGINRE